MIPNAAPELRDTAFNQRRIGLHHFCFRLRLREDVDPLHRAFIDMGAKIVRSLRTDRGRPGYYSVLFEDPDGIRIEANFMPGRGNLDVIKDKPLPSTRMWVRGGKQELETNLFASRDSIARSADTQSR